MNKQLVILLVLGVLTGLLGGTLAKTYQWDGPTSLAFILGTIAVFTIILTLLPVKE